MEVVVVDPLTEFFEAIRSPITRDRYEHRLDTFLKFIRADGSTLRERAASFARKAKQDVAWATFEINEYMRFQKGRAEKREIAESTLANFWKPIKLFCEQNDITLNWKKISRKIPSGRHYANDRAPTREEIISILGYRDRRIRPIVLSMESGGFRVGAWDCLRWGDIKPIYSNGESGELLAARLKVYSGTNDEYTTFITPEAFRAVKEWMDFRLDSGERIAAASWVLRDLWEEIQTTRGGIHQKGLVTHPKQLTATGVARLIERALVAQGVRKKLAEGKRRHEFQQDHGFRKFFNTVCDRHMKTLYVEFLMGHNTGLKESYNRAQEDELLAEYRKAVPELTILEKVDSRSEDVQGLKARMETVEEAMRQVWNLTPEEFSLFKSAKKNGSKILVEEDLQRNTLRIRQLPK